MTKLDKTIDTNRLLARIREAQNKVALAEGGVTPTVLPSIPGLTVKSTSTPADGWGFNFEAGATVKVESTANLADVAQRQKLATDLRTLADALTRLKKVSPTNAKSLSNAHSALAGLRGLVSSDAKAPRPADENFAYAANFPRQANALSAASWLLNVGDALEHSNTPMPELKQLALDTYKLYDCAAYVQQLTDTLTNKIPMSALLGEMKVFDRFPSLRGLEKPAFFAEAAKLVEQGAIGARLPTSTAATLAELGTRQGWGYVPGSFVAELRKNAPELAALLSALAGAHQWAGVGERLARS